MDKINVITLCSGYDSQCMALERIKKDFGLDYDLIAWSEIDKYACEAHDAVFPQFKGRNLGDMTAIDWSKIKDKIDLLVYSTPCQSISSAGLQHGFKEGSGTRSSIIWSTLNAIDVLKPKYLLLENVKAMVSKKFLPDFKSWLDALEERGYKNYWQVLNAKDYGVPQNRERVFVVSILGDEQYQFPKPFELKLRLKDVLESNVDEKYYLSPRFIDTMRRRTIENKQKGNGFKFIVRTGDDIASVVKTRAGSQMEDNYIMAEQKDSLVMEPETIKGISVHPNSRKLEFKGEKSIKEVSPTIRSTDYKCPNCVWYEPNVLTPKRTEYGKEVRKAYESGEIQESRHNMTDMQPIEDGISNTITTVQKDNLLAEPKIIQVANIVGNKGFQNPQRGRVYSPIGISPNIDTMGGGNQEPKIIEPSNTAVEETVGYRIRKLTERECFRLMGLTDADIDKIQSAKISKTQQYRQAGNSIVVDVLYHIFRKMFIDKKIIQPTLF